MTIKYRETTEFTSQSFSLLFTFTFHWQSWWRYNASIVSPTEKCCAYDSRVDCSNVIHSLFFRCPEWESTMWALWRAISYTYDRELFWLIMKFFLIIQMWIIESCNARWRWLWCERRSCGNTVEKCVYDCDVNKLTLALLSRRARSSHLIFYWRFHETYIYLFCIFDWNARTETMSESIQRGITIWASDRVTRKAQWTHATTTIARRVDSRRRSIDSNIRTTSEHSQGDLTHRSK